MDMAELPRGDLLETSMERPAWAPQSIDISVPSVSRIYDFYLGGSHNFEADREAARKAMRFLPGLPKIMQANRAFMRRAVNYAAGRGVTQFLDIVYVDHDAVAVAHSRNLLDGDERSAVVCADLRKPRQILDSHEVTDLLDPEQPVALLLVAVLHFLPDEDDPYAAVAELRDALAPGSLLILTHASYEGIPVPEDVAGGAVGVYEDIRNPLIMRTREQIAAFFEGFEMVEPGLVAMPHWRPDAPVDQEDPYAFSGFSGVGRKA
jgi:SAM-dependent methyltransferase